jgi:hypothetical protein
MAEVLKHIAETPPSRAWKSGSGIAPRSTKMLRLGACPIDDEVQTIVPRTLAKERVRRCQTTSVLASHICHDHSCLGVRGFADYSDLDLLLKICETNSESVTG